MAEIKKGDVVQLKSGGVDMVVQSVGDYTPHGPEDGASCVWDVRGEIRKGIFDCAALHVVAP